MSQRLLVTFACTIALLGFGCGDDDSGPSPTDGGDRDSSTRDASTRDGGMDGNVDDDANVADAGTDAGPPDPAVCMLMHQRADQPTNVMLAMHWDDASQSLRDPGYYHSSSVPASLGMFGHSLAMVSDAVERTNGVRYAGFIDMLFDWQAEVGWASTDFEAVAEAAYGLLRAREVTGEAQYLTAAGALAMVLGNNALDDEEGGLWSSTDEALKTTRVNATGIIVAATLYDLTGNVLALGLAQSTYDYWWETMVDEETHQVYGSIDTKGTISEGDFTGDQGLMIGASLALYRATEDEDYLANAHALAEYLVSDLVDANDVLSDGTEEECPGDCAIGKGIAYRWLLGLWEEDPEARYLEVLSASVDSLFENAWVYGGSTFDAAVWQFDTDWAGPVPTPYSYDYGLRKDVAALTALNLAGHLTPGCDYNQAENVYEAEDARFNGLALFYEYEVSGYQGWNALGGWDAEGKEVTFTIDVEEAGDYTLSFRYAAAAGEATRTLFIDGEMIDPNLAFPATEDWDVWTTAEYVATGLEDGAHTVTLRMTDDLKAQQFLNLDNLTVTPAE